MPHPATGSLARAVREWDRIGDQVSVPCCRRSRRSGTAWPRLARLRAVGGLDFVRTLLSPAAESAGKVGGEAPRLLLAGNAGMPTPLDAAGSGLMGLLICMLGQTVGSPFPRAARGAGPGTGPAARALAGRSVLRRSRGSRSTAGRAVGVGTGTAGRPRPAAVFADVAAPHLYGGLVSADDLPPRSWHRWRSSGWTSTVKVDWALTARSRGSGTGAAPGYASTSPTR